MALTPTAPEWQINTTGYTPFEVLSNGNIVVLDVRPGAAGSKDYVGQIYSPAGAAIGQSFLVKSFDGGDIFSRAIEALPNGRFAVSWEHHPDGSLGNGYLETGIFNSDGSVFKAPIHIGSTEAAFPKIAPLADGGYVMSYEEGGTKTVTFDSNGNPGATVNVSAWEDHWITGLRDGGYITVVDEASGTGPGTAIKAYLRQPNGTVTETLVTTQPDNPAPGLVNHAPSVASVACLANGNLVVAWEVTYADEAKAVKAQIVSPSGALIGGELTLLQDTDLSTSVGRLDPLPDGGFSLSTDKGNLLTGPGLDTYISTYSATGSLVTAPTLAHQDTEGHQYALSVETLKDGSLLAGWLSVVEGKYTTHFQVFSTGSVAPPDTDPAPPSADPGNPSVDPGNPSTDPVEPSGFTRTGTKGKNVLVGGAGNDKFYGGYGNDKLTGLGGADVFVFNTKLGTAKTDRKVNFDTITDFKPREDKIWLDNKIFTKLGKKGTEASPASLNKKFFKFGTKAGDKDDYVIYDKKTGILSYDADGSGAKAAIEIAKLAKNLKLTYHDFAIV